MVKDREPEAYRYVDVWHTDEHGKRSPWRRIALDDLAKYQQETAVNYNCFATIQRFSETIRTKGEAFNAPLYFDLDDLENVGRSQQNTVKVAEFFTKELDLLQSDIEIYFSGKKGFHILVDPAALGVEPRNDLHKIFKHLAGYIIHRLNLTALDLAVYTSSRMLRLPNSVHGGTGLYKIALTLDELKTLTIEEIKEKAKTPRRDGLYTEQGKPSLLRPAAARFYLDKAAEYREISITASGRYKQDNYTFNKAEPPACVTDILTGGWKKDGDRNQATVQLACYFKAAGYTETEATKQLVSWVLRQSAKDSKYQERSTTQLTANTTSVVGAVYAKDNEYSFGCAYIRSLHGDKTPGVTDYERVSCTGALCSSANSVEDTEVVSLHLEQTGRAELSGKLVQTRVMLAGKKSTPYIVPRKIEYTCWGSKGCKKFFCPLHEIPTHTSFKDLGVADRELIQMCGVGDDNIKGLLRELSGIPSCQKYATEVVDSANVEELLVIPMVEHTAGQEDQGGRYVLRKVYAVGSNQLNENKYYQLTGYVYPHPKNQESTIIIKDAEPLQDVVERFVLTDEIKEQLTLLQPGEYTPGAIEKRLTTICTDLTYNVTHIVERDEMLIGVLLTYHSVLRFRVPWDTAPVRGWLECMVVGDTGTGKSALIEKLAAYVGLGARVNAESTSRTGLTYKMEQSGSGGAWYIVWGAWPLADKELIWIDEATGIPKEEYGQMTLARSDGKLEVKRAVTAETPCRVRAILSGNVPKGKRIADYSQGAEALKDIFNNEDIRRFDFAMFLRATDVDPDKYNQQLPYYPTSISGELLKNSILFAWSRKPDQVIFTAGTVDKMLEVSTDLSKVYGSANNIPLVSPSDQRNKIARLAVALAALTHSVDTTGEIVQVTPSHVVFVAAYLKTLYNSPGCGLNYYAKLAIREEELTDEKYDKLTREIRTVDTLRGDVKFYEFIRLFAQQRYLRLGDVEAMLSIDKEEAKAVVHKLVKLRMLVMTSGGYRKTPRFNAYVSKCFELGLFDNIDDDF